jgi:hypothetical protein
MPQRSTPEALTTPEALAAGPQPCDPVAIEAPSTPRIRPCGRRRGLLSLRLGPRSRPLWTAAALQRLATALRDGNRGGGQPSVWRPPNPAASSAPT